MACASARARCWRASISDRPPKDVRWIKQMTEPTVAARRWPLIPTLLVLAAVAVMIALGVWQLQRKSDKEALIALYQRNMAMSSLVTYPELPPVPDAMLYRKSSVVRSDEHTSALQSLMRLSYAG